MKKKNAILITAISLSAILGVAGTACDASSEADLVKQAKITRTQAEKIALAKVPGAKVQSGEIENEHNALVWSFDLVTTGSKNVTEVLVNAKTGKIISVSAKTPSDQAQEKTADQAHAGQ